MKINNKKIDIIFSVCLFLLMLFICSACPRMGDDWGNYINGSGLVGDIKYAIYSYQSYEGRFFSRIFINVLTYNKIFWNFLNPLIISLTYFMFLKFSNHKDKILTPLLLLLSFLFIDYEAFNQGYVWMAGNITYVFPLILIGLILTLNNEKISSKVKKIITFCLPFLTLIFSMFVENVSISIILCFLFFIIQKFIKNKRVDKCMTICLIISVIFSGLMIFSPGNADRLGSHLEFQNMNILEKVIHNLPNFFSYTFVRNPYLLFLIIVLTYNLTKKIILNKRIRLILSIFMLSLSLLSIAVSCLYYFGAENYYINKIISVDHNILILYWLLFSIILLCLFIQYHIKHNKNIYSAIVIFVGLFSNISMLVSPLWGGRTAIPCTLIMSLGVIMELNSFDYKDCEIIAFKKFNIILLMMIGFLLLYGYSKVLIVNNKREEHLIQQLEQDRDIIEVYILSERFLWNPNPWGDGYLCKTFKMFYNIDANKKLSVIEVGE